ncbi:MAG: FmdB family zinc ribbon protein [Acidobacteriota bacterium]|nr:zinc ribbon domain-containing protein [Blastocatellia bacterium]MDW8413377.1 FmdB family zinc ribbon protein [Acidobacteriota bacterium]
MPIYEYVCDSCGKHIERIQKFSDPLLTECDCEEKGTLRKLLSQSSFVLKGGGWYVTDYARKNGKSKDSEQPATCGKPACEATGSCAADIDD